MVKPQPREPMEKVDTRNFTTGIIEKIEYDAARKFSFNKVETICEAIRFKFRLENSADGRWMYMHPHYSRWMKLLYAERSTLYAKYLVSLVENAEPFMDFDLDLLPGMKVSILWTEEPNKKDPKNPYFNVETIRPFGEKLHWTPAEENSDEVENPETEDAPF